MPDPWKKVIDHLDTLSLVVRLDSWNESDHPRAEDGKFGSGGGGSSKSEASKSSKGEPSKAEGGGKSKGGGKIHTYQSYEEWEKHAKSLGATITKESTNGKSHSVAHIPGNPKSSGAFNHEAKSGALMAPKKNEDGKFGSGGGGSSKSSESKPKSGESKFSESLSKMSEAGKAKIGGRSVSVKVNPHARTRYHKKFNEDDYAHLKSKGNSDEDIEKIWDNPKQRGPQGHSQKNEAVKGIGQVLSSKK